LTCMFACVFMLGCSRWGAHLGIPPLYMGDLLLAAAITHSIASRMFIGPRDKTGVAEQSHPGLVVGAFLAWASLRFAFGGDYGFSALRDFAPYGYAVVALFSSNAYSRSTITDRNRSVRIIELALVGHLLWATPAQLLGGGKSPFTGGDLELFVIRSDADGTVLAITACLFLMRYLRQGGLWRLVAVFLSLGGMFSMASRAPVLAAIAGLALTLWYYVISDSPYANRGRHIAMVGMVPVMLIVLFFALPQTPAGSKLLASIGIVQADSTTQQTGLGTQRARSAAWERLLAYTRQDAVRETVGVGFGPHFMIESGASVALVSNDDPAVRSPHNYLLGTFARLGLIGLTLFVLICSQILVGVWRVQQFAAVDDLVFLAAIVPPMILIEATVGVVLEAPFGAIPFFWFLGILLSRPLPESVSGPITPSARSSARCIPGAHGSSEQLISVADRQVRGRIWQRRETGCS
jgi:hypothetical protein